MTVGLIAAATLILAFLMGVVAGVVHAERASGSEPVESPRWWGPAFLVGLALLVAASLNYALG